MNFTRSSMGLHTFQGILRSPQKARLCNPCVQNELSPLSQEGHQTHQTRGRRGRESPPHTRTVKGTRSALARARPIGSARREVDQRLNIFVWVGRSAGMAGTAGKKDLDRMYRRRPGLSQGTEQSSRSRNSGRLPCRDLNSWRTKDRGRPQCLALCCSQQ
jgi:hypothetical protein